MKFLISSFFSLLVLFCSSIVAAYEKKDLLGEWKYKGFIYEDHTYPIPNPNLFLSFTFKQDDIVRLYWKRADEDYFCERTAIYELADETLAQNINWVNPQSHPSCLTDPDMQVGRKTSNRIEIVDQDLRIYMDLNGKPFVYLLEKYGATPEQSKF